MAVEAHHLNLFPSQILGNNRELSMMNSFENGNMLATPIAGSFGLLPPYSSATNTVPMFANDIAMKSDSGLTYAVPNSRKRSRDIMINHPLVPNNHAAKNPRGCFSFLGEDISYQIQQQQLEMDRFIVQHTEIVRSEIERKRKRFAHNILSSMEETITMTLKTKEEEIKKIGKLNYALEQRVKSLCMENQIWRDLAQNNEATANALRTNLEQVISQMQPRAEEAVADDAHSCWGDNYEELEHANVLRNGCRMCGKKEACVLVLPCRHLCLCSDCGSMSIHTCPVCNSVQTASLHVNLT